MRSTQYSSTWGPVIHVDPDKGYSDYLLISSEDLQ